jgi:hypothetical protein
LVEQQLSSGRHSSPARQLSGAVQPAEMQSRNPMPAGMTIDDELQHGISSGANPEAQHWHSFAVPGGRQVKSPITVEHVTSQFSRSRLPRAPC